MTQLQLREGAYYRRADGQVVGPAKEAGRNGHCWLIFDAYYTDHGAYNLNGKQSQRDLLSEVYVSDAHTISDTPPTDSRRFEVARAIFLRMPVVSIENDAGDFHRRYAKLSVRQADALIEELDRKGAG